MTETAVEILLVEDNPNDVELTLRALAKNKLANKVFAVRDGQEALDFLFATGSRTGRANHARPKVVFLDLKLPKVGGLEVLRELKSHEATRSLPVVVVTSSSEEPDVRVAYELGANSYVVKPVDFAKFATAVSELGLYWLVLNQTPDAFWQK